MDPRIYLDMLAQQGQQAAMPPQQPAAPPMQLPPAPPAFTPRPVRYNAPKRQPLIRMGSPLQTGFWGALSLLAPQLATGYLRGRQMSQEQEQQDAMLQYKAAMDEEQQRRQASQDEWDQWGKTANVEMEKRRIANSAIKAEGDPDKEFRDIYAQWLKNPTPSQWPIVRSYGFKANMLLPEEPPMGEVRTPIDAEKLKLALDAARRATSLAQGGDPKAANTVIAPWADFLGMKPLPDNTVGPLAPGETPKPFWFDTKLAPGTAGATREAGLPGVKAKSQVAVNTVPALSARPGLQNKLTEAQTANTAAQPADRDADRALRETIAFANNAIRAMAASQAHADRQAAIAARGSGGGRAPKPKKLTQTELVSVRARNSHVPPPVWKNLESVGIAPGPQALASAKFYASDAGGKVLKEDLNGVFSVNPAANPEYMAAFVKNQDEWKRGVHQWVNGRQVERDAPKSAAPKAAPKPAPANPMRKTAKTGNDPAYSSLKAAAKNGHTWQEMAKSPSVSALPKAQRDAYHQFFLRNGGRER